MQNDDLPDSLRPLMVHDNRSLNLRSIYIVCRGYNTDLSRLEPHLFILERDGRIVMSSPPLEEGDSV